MADLDHVHILNSFLPDDEKELARLLEHQVMDLDSYIRNFESAVRLMDYCDPLIAAADKKHDDLTSLFLRKEISLDAMLVERDPLPGISHFYWGWKHLAARDAAMTIWHFEIALDSVIKAAKQLPVLSTYVDDTWLHQAQPLFAKYFPQSATMRNAVGHRSEMTASRKSLERNAFDGELETGNITMGPEAKGLIMEGVMEDRKMSSTFAPKGKESRIVSVDVTEENLGHLLEIKQAIWEAIRPASEASRQALRERVTLKARGTP